MARYIKANYKVAEYLHLETERNQVKDGNYLLWQADILAFGRLTQLAEICEQIGAIALMAHEAREEQDGTVIRPLPTATDERFIIEEAKGADEDEPVEEAGETDNTEETTTEETDTTAEAEEEPKENKEG